VTGPDDKAGLGSAVQQTGQTLGETVGEVGELGTDVARPVVDEADAAAAEALETLEAAQSAVDGVVATITGILRSRFAIVVVAGVAIAVGALVWRRR
jgi:hypothetical protein